MAKNYARHFCIFSVIFFSCSSHGYCQSRTVIIIPVLKEKAAIDTLLSKALNPNTEPGKSISKQVSKDKCLLLSIRSLNDGSELFVVEVCHTELINFYINLRKYHKDAFGYFSYDGFKVFMLPAISNAFSANYFSKTTQSKSFNFLYKTVVKKFPDRKYLRDVFPIDFEFRNGKFSYRKPMALY